MPEPHVLIRLSSFGDVLLTTGVIDYWNKTGRIQFYIVTKDSFACIFENHPGVKSIIPVTQKNLNGLSWWKFCHYLKQNYPSSPLIDLHVNLRTAMLRRIWSNETYSYSKMSLYRRLFAKTGLSPFKQKLLCRNVPQRYVKALPGNIPSPAELTPKIFLKNDEIQQAAQKLQSIDAIPECIAIHPYATHPAKTWNKDKWRKFIKFLENKGYDWLIIGQDKQPLFPEKNKDLTNKTSIRETGAILSHCKALITGDSGPMHLASAVGTRVISLFGPTSKEWGFYPAGLNDCVLETRLKCRPCSLHGKSKSSCHQECLNSISFDQLTKALKTH
ncbi:MAG: glycosyltransferase family 9 protein [Desulfonatronovibrio sp.]